MATALNIDDFEPTAVDDGASTYLYPTVRRGPIDSNKAVTFLNWGPTRFEDAIKETVEFYEKAMRNKAYKTQQDEIIQVKSL